MTAPRPELRLAGATAAPGLAVGPAFPVDAAPRRRQRVAGGPDEEAAALRAALEAAGDQLTALIGSADRLAGEILEFQLLLAEDEELVGAAFRRIAGGQRAEAAWTETLNAEIADYEAATDETMAARAADFADLRDRVLGLLLGGDAPALAPPDGAILLADDLPPSAFLALDWSRLGGVALAGGSPTSHVAILARARGAPMVVGLGALPPVAPGETVALDAGEGLLIVSPAEQTRAAFAARAAIAARERAADAEAARRPAVDAAGRRVRVLVNVDDPSAIGTLDPAHVDGVGLVRSEFLFAAGAPSEATQLSAYARILRWADGKPVTVRTLDAGGDKPVPGVTADGESNPFLGVRGLRLSLARPDLFRVQLRALARAAALGPLKVMLPMVTVPAELEAARAHLDAVCAALAAEGVAHARPPLGIMVETPSAALLAERFDAAFYSIGSNDLIQYVAAAARDNPAVAPLADPRNPAVLALIARTVEAGRRRGVEVSLCGDMASRPDLVGELLSLGLDTFSVAPALVGAVKRAIAAAPGPAPA